MKKLKISVCMGSSCFIRGNKKNLEFIETIIAHEKLDAEIELIGNRCQKKCAIGPNIIINDQTYYNVMEKDLKEIFSKIVTKE